MQSNPIEIHLVNGAYAELSTGWIRIGYPEHSCHNAKNGLEKFS